VSIATALVVGPISTLLLPDSVPPVYVALTPLNNNGIAHASDTETNGDATNNSVIADIQLRNNRQDPSTPVTELAA
jgi:hypothetical protein